MNRRRFTALLGSATAARLTVAAPPDGDWERYERVHPTMGTQFRFLAYAPSPETAKTAFDAAARRLDGLNAALSDYVSTSEISRLSAASGRGDWRLLSSDAWRVLTCAQKLAKETKGAFDVTVGPLTLLWRHSRRQGRLPTANRLEEALAATGHAHLQLDPERQRARGQRPNMRIDLGGIAKGYALDTVAETLRHHGITTALIDGGGDLRMLGTPPHAAGWRVQIADLDPSDTRTHVFTDGAMATSGDLYQSVEIDGRRYSHLIDPQTGLGLTFRRTVTVIAADGMTADALASALSVLSPARSSALLQTHYPDVVAQILTQTPTGLEKVVLGRGKHRAAFH